MAVRLRLRIKVDEKILTLYRYKAAALKLLLHSFSSQLMMQKLSASGLLKRLMKSF